MKYQLYTLIALVIAAIPAFLQSDHPRLISETVTIAWRQRSTEKRALQGASFLRSVYAITPEQTIRFTSRDGDICYFAESLDARRSPELVYAFLESGSKHVRYQLAFTDINGVCDGQGSRDLTAAVE